MLDHRKKTTHYLVFFYVPPVTEGWGKDRVIFCGPFFPPPPHDQPFSKGSFQLPPREAFAAAPGSGTGRRPTTGRRAGAALRPPASSPLFSFFTGQGPPLRLRSRWRGEQRQSFTPSGSAPASKEAPPGAPLDSCFFFHRLLFSFPLQTVDHLSFDKFGLLR